MITIITICMIIKLALTYAENLKGMISYVINHHHNLLLIIISSSSSSIHESSIIMIVIAYPVVIHNIINV